MQRSRKQVGKRKTRSGELAKKEQNPGPVSCTQEASTPFQFHFSRVLDFQTELFWPWEYVTHRTKKEFHSLYGSTFQTVYSKSSNNVARKFRKRVRLPGVPTVAVRRVACADLKLRGETRWRPANARGPGYPFQNYKRTRSRLSNECKSYCKCVWIWKCLSENFMKFGHYVEPENPPPSWKFW